MTKEEEDGLQYIIDVLNDFSSNTNKEEVTVELINHNDKIIIKENNKVTNVINNRSDNYRDILEIQESLRSEHDKNKS